MISTRTFIFSAWVVLCATPAFAQNEFKISWDNYGIPHCEANTDAGVLLAQGYAMGLCQAPHVFAIYAKAMGISARYFGNPCADPWDSCIYAKNDYLVKLWEIPHMATTVCKGMDEKVLGLLEAFCAGINIAKKIWLPLGQKALGAYYPLMEDMQVSPVEVVAAYLRYYFLPFAYVHAHKAAKGDLTQYDVFPNRGSNSWALLDQDGTAWLMIDPHIPLGIPPGGDESQLIFASELDSKQGLHISGYNALGLPFQAVGVKHASPTVNGDQVMAWTYTSAPTDLVDVFELKWEVLTDRYEMQDGWKDFIHKTLLIDLPEPYDPLEIHAKYTQDHGPVVCEGDLGYPNHGGKLYRKVYAGRGVWQVWEDCRNMAEQWYDMLTAKNLEELLCAMDSMALPGGNLTIATNSPDMKNRLCFLLYNPVPVRGGDGIDWTQPVNGSRYENIWNDVHPRHWLPTAYGNQQECFINCNCSIDITYEGFKSSSYPAYPKYLIGDWGIYTVRQERAQEILESVLPHEVNYDLMYSAATDKSHGNARHLVPLIKDACDQWKQYFPSPEILEYLTLRLVEWDNVARIDSQETYLFQLWEKAFLEIGKQKDLPYVEKFFNFASHYPVEFNETEGLDALCALLIAFDIFQNKGINQRTWGANHLINRITDLGESLSCPVSGTGSCLRAAQGFILNKDYMIDVDFGQTCPMIVKLTDPPIVWFSKAIDNCTWPQAWWLFDKNCSCTKNWVDEIYTQF